MAKRGSAWFRTQKEPVGWAVVGLGMGRLHARYVNRSPRLKLVALCDASPAALDAAGKEFPAALRCMKAGRHVAVVEAAYRSTRTGRVVALDEELF